MNSISYGMYLIFLVLGHNASHLEYDLAIGETQRLMETTVYICIKHSFQLEDFLNRKQGILYLTSLFSYKET